MDKQTLSNYGWIVICILVLSVMIAFATPFGSFIGDGFKSITSGFFDTSKKALEVVGMNLPDQEFEGSGTSQPKVPGATFTDGTFLTWEELKLAENARKYGYKASYITDTSIGNYAFMECTSLTSIDLSGCTSLTSIGNSVFNKCTSLTSIDLSGCTSLTSISSSAFYSCTSLTSIDLPASLTSIETGAFEGCTSLTSIDLPASLTSIGNSAFMECTSLTSIDLSGCTSLTSIGNYTFMECTSLTSIDLPASLTSIKIYAFYSCTALTSIDYAGTMEEWGNISLDVAWRNNSAIKQIICNDGIITL